MHYVVNEGGSEAIVAMNKGEADIKAVTEAMWAPFFASGDDRPLVYLRNQPSELMILWALKNVVTAAEAVIRIGAYMPLADLLYARRAC